MTETAEQINNTTSQLNKRIKREVFDPRIIEDAGKQMLWTSESVELADKGLAEGYKLRDNPYLKTVKGVKLRKSGLPFKYSEDELDVLKIAFNDKKFFANNFGKLKDGDKGWTNIKLRDYQENFLDRITNNQWNIIMFPRQSGKTTTMVLEIIHYMISNLDKDVVVIAQSDKVVNEILGKIKEAFAGLPFFMQPGFISFNKKGCTLDNGCRLSIGIASESVVQGFSLDLLYIDEFAYIKNNMVSKFWRNIYPTLINNPNSRCIITSTPNGRNLFHDLWVGAESNQNRFIPYRIYWYDIPGRDNQFKYDTIANVGLEGWEMGFECSFDTQLKSIFNTNVQKYLRKYQLDYKPLWSTNNNPLGIEYDIEFVNQAKVKYNFKTDFFVVGIDLAEGLGQDYTTMKIKKVEWDVNIKKLVYKSIGVYKSNMISVEDFAELCMNLFMNFDANKLRVAVENNNYGGEYFLQINSLKTYETKYKKFDSTIFAKFNRDSKKGFEYGIRWNSRNKKLAVKSFSNLISKKIITESHYLSIEEYLNFGKISGGSYAAQYGHDDLVMADVSLSHFIKTNNIYSHSFFEVAETELRILNDDEDEEVKRIKAEKERKKRTVYKSRDFQLRNHEDEVKKAELSDANILLLSCDF